eukprot:Gregarina_sp_Poly_1__2523@NODE_1683_length_3539_cov_192_490207_g1106_i0_p5_GENE_NODE_1683_length_3539_cov_192_490207_g1106_i0NODE_1683_length_3539_cov_192_490207_g1106_i0_p5_ORF_typecomplete_len127_score18_42_NODE_1683_length_3539_cov_192_490207_g1106_i030723452
MPLKQCMHSNMMNYSYAMMPGGDVPRQVRMENASPATSESPPRLHPYQCPETLNYVPKANIDEKWMCDPTVPVKRNVFPVGNYLWDLNLRADQVSVEPPMKYADPRFEKPAPPLKAHKNRSSPFCC